MTHPLAGRKQSPEHVAKRVEATRRARSRWTEERHELFRERVSANNKSNTPEAKAKNAAAHLGNTPWNKGLPQGEEQKHRHSIAMKGRPSPLKGILRGKQSAEHVHKRVEGRRGYRHSEETKERIRETNLQTWSTPGVRSKVTGSNSPSWRGGISFEPYPTDWTAQLRTIIRNRDGRRCQACRRMDRPLDVHHIDYDKANLDPRNLISLCHSCHMKTNYRRSYWTNIFGGQNE